jgi:hypothetical protein
MIFVIRKVALVVASELAANCAGYVVKRIVKAYM